MSKDSFVFYRDWFVAIKELDDATRLELYDSIMYEAFGLDKKELSSMASVAMKFIKQQIERDNKKYEAICRRNIENGKKGGRPKRNPENPVGFLETQENPEKPKKAYNDIIDTDVSINSNNIKENKEDTNVSKKEKSDNLFEECWKTYNRKGSKKKSQEQWGKLSCGERQQVLPHIKMYVSSRDRQYQKDFERYLRDKTFKEIIVKGDKTIFDPDMFDKFGEYHPVVDGIFQIWSEEQKCLLFNGDIRMIADGYTDDNRPDGARASWGMYLWVWSKQRKEWVKQ